MVDTANGEHPTRFGQFRVIAPLASGGMGAVYLAQDSSGRAAVVKTIRADLAADPAYRARFRSEAQAALRVRSNLVARVWDCDANADPPWIALEKIDGPTLREVVNNGRVMDNVALSAFAADLAEGIHAFYDQGMAHGDLTPSNIVIQDGNRLKILDLGLARPTADETATGDLPALGTPYWLAPEVAAGFAPDNLSDVNQWGKLVLFAGTGYPQLGPGNLREALALLASPLRVVVEHCISALPDIRPQPEALWNQTRERRLTGSAPPLLVLARTRLTVQPGDEAETTATAGNQSATSEAYRFEVLGPARQWARIDQPTAWISAGGEADVQVTFCPPIRSLVPPGDWPFALRCVAEVDDGRAAVAEGMIAVRSVSNVRIELVAEAPRGRWTGCYALSVHNRGNAAERLRLTVAEPRDHLSFAISPPLLDLRPGDGAVGLVKVRTRRPSLLGNPVEHPFRISATADDATDVAGSSEDTSVGASFHQDPILPRRVAAVVIVAMVMTAVILGGVRLLG